MSDFAELCVTHPDGGSTRAARIWLSLGAAERAAATAALPDFIAAMRKQGRHMLPPLQSYLGDRRWELMAAARAASP